MGYYSAWRVRRLGLDGILDVLYSQQDHDLPRGLTPEQARTLPDDEYDLQYTLHENTPRGEVKPNPKLLLHILDSVSADPSQSLYVGDSLTKDISMAQAANVRDVYAEYGPAHLNQHRERYELLRRVTHWTDAEVAEEIELSKHKANPSYTLKETFAEILTLFEFVTFDRPQS